ncbi:uncharacterized protein CANTADRAFT_55996 [Suhomyces tanzawaensis NRRL Y-17324]|uniref:K Homology domain-containing protein n=1 Tax=Suhomyces tanzawaensis NRRL Y-17324 TaxID=984487 RepID=A0A1E4SDV6_9ASCO|nr:uncharacterized protein CANTADRAFT_55996 [Suhomyces tanzawaensis NRRL Y-17324]ODV77663.1 hypothetical protein CANTADRAFT_55996 [Suhomyces tanzawaensis NRRL Y-17324]
MTESLFDTKFTSEANVGGNSNDIESSLNVPSTSSSNIGENASPHESSSIQAGVIESDAVSPAQSELSEQSTSLPSLHDKTNASALINYRVLVSAKESGCLIGQNGRVIDSIRAETNTKAGISRLQPGSHERILTVSGTLDECAKALSYFAQALCESAIETYNFFPLKQLSANPCIENETTILRLLIPNSQMGTLIGSKGLRIQQIQTQYNISMIASKSFLPGSNERLVELQGSVDDLYDAIRIISRCLIEDFSSIVGTNYYIPRGHGFNNGIGAGAPIPKTAAAPFRKNQNITTTSLSFPNEIVGALIGKNGSRIQGVRKVSGATIGISEEVEGKDERIFTISGSTHAVEKAKDLLYHNLEREEQRRAEAENN